jgi:hypothetical protein
MFSFGITGTETDCPHDDRLEVMAAQARAWTERANSFDILGRYESRLSRQLLKYQEEFECLQAVRKEQERIDSHRSRNEIKRDQFDQASFGAATAAILEGPGAYRILTHLPPPKDLQKGVGSVDPGGAGDLVAGVSPQPPDQMAANRCKPPDRPTHATSVSDPLLSCLLSVFIRANGSRSQPECEIIAHR